MEEHPMKPLATILCWLLGTLLLYAGGLKFAAPETFAAQIQAYRLLPNGLVPFMAVTLPMVELFLGAALFLPGRPRRAALLGIHLLILIFLAAMLSAYGRGLNIDCGCFGNEGLPLPWAMARNLLLLALSTALLLREYNTLKTAPQPAPPQPAPVS